VKPAVIVAGLATGLLILPASILVPLALLLVAAHRGNEGFGTAVRFGLAHLRSAWIAGERGR
jgi:hypothetical protein